MALVDINIATAPLRRLWLVAVAFLALSHTGTSDAQIGMSDSHNLRLTCLLQTSDEAVSACQWLRGKNPGDQQVITRLQQLVPAPIVVPARSTPDLPARVYSTEPSEKPLPERAPAPLAKPVTVELAAQSATTEKRTQQPVQASSSDSTVTANDSVASEQPKRVQPSNAIEDAASVSSESSVDVSTDSSMASTLQSIYAAERVFANPTSVGTVADESRQTDDADADAGALPVPSQIDDETKPAKSRSPQAVTALESVDSSTPPTHRLTHAQLGDAGDVSVETVTPSTFYSVQTNSLESSVEQRHGGADEFRVNNYLLSGVLGCLLYLGPWLLLKSGLLSGRGIVHSLLNLLAASLVLVSLMDQFNVTSTLIHVAWVVVCLAGIVRLGWKRGRGKTREPVSRADQSDTEFFLIAPAQTPTVKLAPGRAM